MKVKDKFMLTAGAPNILDIPKAQVESLMLEGNSPRHVYVALELKKNQIRHEGVDTILNYLKGVKHTNDLEILSIDQYPLIASYNRKTNSKVVNTTPFNTKEIGRIAYPNLYASVLYAYTFDHLVNNKIRIPDNMAQPMSNFWFSFFVQVFGRDYGMTGAYSSKLPGLKFVITLYLLIAFFGREQNRSTYNTARLYSGFDFDNHTETLNQIDISNIRGFIQALNQLDIMPGFNIIKFTTKIARTFEVQMMPMFEDASRFLSLIMVSSVSGQTFSKSFINKYNRRAYIDMLNYMKKRLF